VSEETLQSGADVVPKGTLFCPECEYSDRYDGAWQVVTTGRTARYRCPECDAVVTSRSSERSERLGPLAQWRAVWDAWRAGVRRWSRLPNRSASDSVRR
jgi:transposase-like protein